MSKAVQKYEEETPAHSPETVVALVQHQLSRERSQQRSFLQCPSLSPKDASSNPMDSDQAHCPHKCLVQLQNGDPYSW